MNNIWQLVKSLYAYQFILSRWLITAVMSVLLICCASCAELRPRGLSAPDAGTQAPTHAEALFLKKDYEHALLEYEQRYETSLSADDKNQALYGLACTQLALARTPDQLTEAIDNLQKWNTAKGNAPFSENRQMMILALKQQDTLLKEKSHAATHQEIRKNSVIADQEAKINQLSADNENLQLEIKKLQKQIEEIEAIDANVQSKRKSL